MSIMLRSMGKRSPKEIKPLPGDFIEIRTDDDKKVCCVIFSMGQSHRVIEYGDAEAERYSQMFGVEIAKPIIAKDSMDVSGFKNKR